MALWMADCTPLTEETALTRALPHLDTARRAAVTRQQNGQTRAQHAAAGLLLTLFFRSVKVRGTAQLLILLSLSFLLPALAGTFGVFLMRQFMVSAIPDAILEAARIDGANEYKIFWSISMPCVKPAWMTLIIFTFQSLWSATGGTYIYEESMRMLPNVLSQIAAGGIARTGAGSAVAVIIMIPPIIVFLISQSSVMETMAQSGIK